MSVKDTEPGELIRAVRVAAGGNALLSPGVTRRLISEFASRAQRPNRPFGRCLDQLTEREREITALLAEGLSNDEIAAVGPGTHRLQVRLLTLFRKRPGRRSPVVTFELADGDVAEFACNPPKYPRTSWWWIVCVLGDPGRWLEIEAGPVTGAAIDVRHLHKTYGATVAVDDISFSVTEGEIFGLLDLYRSFYPDPAGTTRSYAAAAGLGAPSYYVGMFFAGLFLPRSCTGRSGGACTWSPACTYDPFCQAGWSCRCSFRPEIMFVQWFPGS